MKANLHFHCIFLVLLSVMVFVPTTADAGRLGVFESETEVGNPVLQGGVHYDVGRQTYRVRGAGANIWADHDEFHYVWKQLRGNFILRARAAFIGEGIEPHRKLGWMVRSTLGADSPHVNGVVHGDGLTSLQFRRSAGGITEEVKASVTHADVIQLERRGDRYLLSVAQFGQPFVTMEIDDLKLGDEVYVGLFVCAHNPEVTEEAIFKDVRITVPAPETFVPYRDYLGSRLETLDVDTGDRRVVFATPRGIEAPNWTPDGTTLIYNCEGRLYRFPLADGEPVLMDTGLANRNNNDHVLSFDGRTLGLSHQPKETGDQSVIYTVPVTGGEPRRVTDKFPSYLHGWSPDGKFLVYTGQRNGAFDIYRIPVAGGEEVRLTTADGLDDGPEYSPDGRFIYFNSARTGTMQIWRMKPDGSDQEQLTHDELNDWFPHVSPDGRRVVFLSFSKEVPADQHPYYQRVYLRMIPLDGGEPQVVAYVYGGQGTLNVPSWSPDNRHVAFVSHTGG